MVPNQPSDLAHLSPFSRFFFWYFAAPIIEAQKTVDIVEIIAS